MKQETQKQIDELKSKINELEQSLLEPVTTGIRFRAEPGEFYWCVEESGVIERNREMSDDVDNDHYLAGNYFETGAQVQAKQNRDLAEQRIFDFIAKGNAEEGWVADWSDADKRKWAVVYDYHVMRLLTEGVFQFQTADARYYGHKNVIGKALVELKRDYLTVFGYEGKAK